MNFWDFFNKVLNCRAMTEQKPRDAKPRHIQVQVQVAVTLLLFFISLFPLFTTCFLLKKIANNIAMVIYFVLEGRTKFFSKSYTTTSMFLSNFNNSPVLKYNKSC